MRINADASKSVPKMSELEELEAIERKTKELVRELSVQPQEEVVELRDADGDADLIKVSTFVSVRLDDDEKD